jgi:hypothetical protein
MSRLYPTLEDMKVDQMQQVCFKINNIMEDCSISLLSGLLLKNKD